MVHGKVKKGISVEFDGIVFASIVDAARHYSTNPATIRKWLKQGELPDACHDTDVS